MNQFLKSVTSIKRSFLEETSKNTDMKSRYDHPEKQGGGEEDEGIENKTKKALI